MTVKQSDNHLAVAGLGNLGAPIACRLVVSGWKTIVWDPAAEKRERVASQGAVPASSARDLGDADVLVLVVPDDRAAEELLLGDQGWLRRDRHDDTADRMVLVHSTLLPTRTVELAEHAKAQGIRYLDVPVSGGADRAQRGDLTIFAGGEAADLSAARAVLDAVGSTIHHMGPVGAGAATKLANQLMMFSALAGAYEAIDLVSRYGVGETDLLAAVASSTGASWVSQHWGFFDQTARAYDQGGTPVQDRPWGKDLGEFLESAHSSGLEAPLAELLARTLAQRVEQHARASGGSNA